VRYLLDTNVVSAFRFPRGARPALDPVWAWSDTVATGDLAISVITVLEMELGARLKDRRDPGQARGLFAYLHDGVLPDFSGRVLPIDSAVALRAAALHVPDPAPERDALIAAAALVHDLTVVTRNVADFTRTGVRLLDPWRTA